MDLDMDRDVDPRSADAPGDVPMTRPHELLAVHENFGKAGFVALEGGRILACATRGFTYSDDGGLTWSEGYEGTRADGEKVGSANLVRLPGNAIGCVQRRTMPGATAPGEAECLFSTSDDQGRTWSDPVLMNQGHQRAHPFKGSTIRTRSGRIIQPVYHRMGQGSWHHEEAPFVGGFVNGRFVSTDAHFFDPHFAASYVLYSDDDGRTWQPNRDGELFIHLEPGGPCYKATEPSVVEVDPDTLLMIMRTTLGRLFQSWSTDDGETWSRPIPTQLAGTQAPGQLCRLPATGHLLVVWTQVSSEEVRQGYIRARLSAAVSRNGGGMWEFFQNVESILEGTHVEPGPIESTRPQACYPVNPRRAACDFDVRYARPLPANYGRFSYPTVLALEDRVLISHGYSWHDEHGDQHVAPKLKVLPLRWFYGGQDPTARSDILDKIETQCPTA